MKVFWFSASFLISCLLAPLVPGQGLPFRYRENVLSGVGNNPVFLTHAKDGTRRLFLVEQAGVIKVYQPGSTTPTTFMNITTRVMSGGERGLLGLAFHPQYFSNRRFFVYYTRQTDGAIQIAEYQASAADANIASTTEKIIITIPHPTNANHNGGTVGFGPDGYLYAGTGDGGSGNDPPNNAQNINQLLGKFIRLDVDNVPVGQVPQYNIPPDNPFVGVAGADEIYAVGLRNPFRFSFDRGGTNQLWAGDVGQGSWEEVDIITRGGNYGWRIYEGNHCTNLDGCGFPANYVPPVFEYSSSGGGNPRCTVIGGYVYRGDQRALNPGTYIYADYCSGEILSWDGSQQTVLRDTSRNIVSFGEDEDGELYAIHAPQAGGIGAVDKIMGNRTSADFDGDLKVDQMVFRPLDSVWYSRNSSNSQTTAQQWGNPTDIPTPEDFDGDGKADIAIFRPSTGVWWIIRSSDSVWIGIQFGSNGDIPSAGDFDGDGMADPTVYRPDGGNWYSRRSTDLGWTAVQWGASTDLPVSSDYDGDNRTDFAVWRPSDGYWWVINSTTGNFSGVQWGSDGDIPITGDYNGDSRSDFMILRQSDGFMWHLRRNVTFDFVSTQWGSDGDIPAAGDYDGDMIDDIAVFRPSSGHWYYIGSATGSQTLSSWGSPGDKPAPAFDTP